MNEIRQIRLSLGFSQREMANFLALPKATISMAEKGERQLPEEVLAYIRFLNANNAALSELHPDITAEMSRRKMNSDAKLKQDYQEIILRIEEKLRDLEREIELKEAFSAELQSKLAILNAELSATLPGSRQHTKLMSQVNRLLDLYYRPRDLYYQLLEVKRNCLQAELDGYRAVLGS